MELNPKTLVPLMKGDVRRAALWAAALAEAMQRYEIATPTRIAAFLAQLAHESDGFSQLVENFRYSAQRLCAVWPRHFYLDPDVPGERVNAADCEYKPELIANLVYANRMANGGPDSGDGWRYRGRGLLQVTGRKNYKLLAQDMSLDLEGSPDLLVEPLNAAVSAALMWRRVGANELADANTEESFRAITVAINGGEQGMDSRLNFWLLAQESLGG